MKSFLYTFLCLCLFASCQKTQDKRKPDWLYINFGMEPSSDDVRRSTEPTTHYLNELIGEGLVKISPEGEILLAQAERIEVSPDGTAYTFYLKDTLWSDGQPVTAQNFRSSWLECLDPNFPCPNAYLFYPIKNAKPAKKGKFPLDQVGIEVLNSKCLRVHLEKPNSTFLSRISSTFFYPVRYKKEGSREIENRLYNGPFTISQWKRGQKIKLLHNPFYRNSENIFFEVIDVSLVADQNTAYELFMNQQLDFVGSAYSFLPAAILETVMEGRTAVAASSVMITVCSFNTRKFPFNNVNFRKALSAAIDRDIIAAALNKQKALPAYSIVPDGFKPRNYASFVDAEIAEAKQYLAKAMEETGIKELRDFPKMKLLFGNPYYNLVTRRIAQILQDQWREVLGIDIALETYDLKHVTSKMSNMEYDIGLLNWSANYPHPISFLERFLTKDNPKNYSGWESREFQTEIFSSIESLDRETQIASLIKSEEILAQDVPIFPIISWDMIILPSQRLANLKVLKSGSLWIESLKINSPERSLSGEP